MAQAAPLQASGSQPGGASSKPAKSKPGATVHPTRVQAPRLFACCQACAGTIACGCSPVASSQPSRTSRRCPVLDDAEQQGRAGVPVPHLGRIDLVPARDLACPQQEIDGGGGRAVRACASDRSVAERLAIMPAFWMRLEAEQANHVVCGHVGAMDIPCQWVGLNASRARDISGQQLSACLCRCCFDGATWQPAKLFCGAARAPACRPADAAAMEDAGASAR